MNALSPTLICRGDAASGGWSDVYNLKPEAFDQFFGRVTDIASCCDNQGLGDGGCGDQNPRLRRQSGCAGFGLRFIKHYGHQG